MDTTHAGEIVDAYSGPGGWSEGLRTLGLTDIGIEWDAAACATRAAAGHRTIRADVATFPLDHLIGMIIGAILSPPCQAFSTAGNGEGRDVIPDLAAAIRRGDWRWSHADDRVRHVLEVGRWTETLRPTWIACEQVPPVLPLWQAYADRWRALYGWSVWCGVLNAADYGVPQTRRRAFLIARTDGAPVGPPVPTHCKGGSATLFGELAPWISMADALGWGVPSEPSPVVMTARNRQTGHDVLRGSSWRAEWFARQQREGNWIPRDEVVLNPDSEGTHGRVLDRRQQSDGKPVRLVDCDTEPAPTVTGIAGAKSQWVFHRPATTVAGDPRLSGPGRNDPDIPGSQYGENSLRLTIRDALILQGFPPDYPVQGTRTKQFEQIGNAVPPPLAAAVIAALTGTTTARRAA